MRSFGFLIHLALRPLLPRCPDPCFSHGRQGHAEHADFFVAQGAVELAADLDVRLLPVALRNAAGRQLALDERSQHLVVQLAEERVAEGRLQVAGDLDQAGEAVYAEGGAGDARAQARAADIHDPAVALGLAVAEADGQIARNANGLTSVLLTHAGTPSLSTRP